MDKKKENIRKEYRIKKLGQNDKIQRELASECSEKIRTCDTPYLERFYDIRELCTTKGKVNFRHCFSTFMLSSRFEFDCLDTFDRIRNFKTPIRSSQQPLTQNNQSTPKTRRSKRKRPEQDKSPSIEQPAAKTSKFSEISHDMRLDRWIGDTVFCRFCQNILNETQKRDKSHLIFECKEIPNSTPVNKKINNRERPRAIHKRLAEIAAHFDPGGF